MTDKEKYLLLGGIALVGIGWWWYSGHMTATAQIVSQPTASPAASSTVSVTPPIASSSTSGGQPGVNQQEYAALMAWTQKTANPSLYQQMINLLSATQIDQLYGILTTSWTTGANPTPTQTAFWNGLVQQYPFLATGGQGCTTLTCT